MAEEQFVVYFQPKYSLNEESMVGAEALVRWIHPEWGFISPGEFIPLFEKTGFITRLDQYVWERACMYLCDWKKKGYPLRPISVNVSRADIYQMDLIACLVGIVQKYDVDPAYLHLEITESAYAENPVKIIKTVEQLRKIGFIVCAGEVVSRVVNSGITVLLACSVRFCLTCSRCFAICVLCNVFVLAPFLCSVIVLNWVIF